MKKAPQKKKLICLCNSISEDEIIKAIEAGANSLGEVFDITTAGVGACGGSCRPQITELLKKYKKN